MSERFGFACFLYGPKFQSPASAISTASAAFPDRIGMPVEAMVLDVQSDRQEVRPWPGGEALLHHAPGPTELLFTYYTSLGSSPGRVCIGFEQSNAAATVTVSLPNMAIANQHDDVAAACGRLHGLCLALCAACVVAAGGEIEFEKTHETTADALAAMLAPLSVAQWIASDAESLLSGHPGFEIVCQSGAAVVLRRT